MRRTAGAWLRKGLAALAAPACAGVDASSPTEADWPSTMRFRPSAVWCTAGGD
ncbi:hypothetical protein WJ968_13105 [Achromobacter xylosoxidans]